MCVSSVDPSAFPAAVEAGALMVGSLNLLLLSLFLLSEEFISNEMKLINKVAFVNSTKWRRITSKKSDS